MPLLVRFALAFVLTLLGGYDLDAQTVRPIGSSTELHAILEARLDSVEIRLLPGTYHLVPTPQLETPCASCPDSADDPIVTTLGVRVSGRGVRLIGPADRSAEIVTHAGNGIVVEDCLGCSIENLTVTGGERDTASSAINAAIVVRRSTVAIRNNRIAENLGDSTRGEVGIIGIAGREGSDMVIEGNEILRSSHDGIALFRSSLALVRGNVVDGAGTAHRVPPSRGTGISLHANAIATIEGNLVRRYHSGITIADDADAIVRRNVVEEIAGVGITFGSGDASAARGEIVDNVIFSTARPGALIARGASGADAGRFERNVLIATATGPDNVPTDYYCGDCALALKSVPSGFRIDDNLFFDNRRGDRDTTWVDVSDEVFLPAIRAWCGPMSTLPALGRSDFIRRFCVSDGEIGSGRP